jgi:hypothetical protein
MKYLFLSVLVVSLVGVLVIPDVFADRTYTNEKYDFSLQYPANWKVSELHLVDKASNSETILELTSPRYEADGCINGQCGQGLWYGYDRIIISRDILPNSPAFSTTSLKDTANLMFDAYRIVCQQMTFGNIYQKTCQNPKLMDDTIHTIGTHSKIDTVKIVATSAIASKIGSGTSSSILQYYPVMINMAWYDKVDRHNWQITMTMDDFRSSNGYGSNEQTSDIMYGITDSFTFDRPQSTTLLTDQEKQQSGATGLLPDLGESDPTRQVGGGCLIATAAFGSELAPQVQLLREIRDNTVLQTESGYAFMTGFNQFYYSFSPAVADYERENPVFKEAVKITLTPLLTSLTLLQYADIDSESEMLGYGIGVILLNIGMYFVVPAVLIMKIRK